MFHKDSLLDFLSFKLNFFRNFGNSKLYCARLGLVDFDSARQSKIEAERFGKVAASQNPLNLTTLSIKGVQFMSSIEGAGGPTPISPRDIHMYEEEYKKSAQL